MKNELGKFLESEENELELGKFLESDMLEITDDEVYAAATPTALLAGAAGGVVTYVSNQTCPTTACTRAC
ncbi:class II lanthipeptide, LchA2/BrtA2 family [Staphylococcus caeli]|uniref:Lantibiotic lacticin 3147 A2 n=1 Tax=Staphylococcus caeli TaxID=2201815 RepID=A0A1D4NUC1_9STAP|nr:class II lanthipeptide, LchA2/BrtA2 family [Staphylococcus caeli]AWM30209.1 lantibiotic lacticin 3147 A2 [Staphylococcus caeli]SCT08881.1 Lantibiotic lacticin 3147 A2 precursor [Staphylococcus caeli]SCT14201.1 Lantibiotic lacticin 3147 A2 precursor [Staphylococcus caeli]